MLTKEQYHQAFVESGGVTEEEFQKAIANAKKGDFYEAVIEHTPLTDPQAGQLLAEYFGVGFVKLGQVKIDKKTVMRIPESFGRARQVIPLLEDDRVVKVATSDPRNVLLKAALEKYLRKDILFVYASAKDIETNIRLFQEDTSSVFRRILENHRAGSPLGNTIVELVDVMIEHAAAQHASDIHIEPEDTKTLIRYRVDGILHDVTTVPKDIHENIATRIKVMSRLATDERRAAQDGKIQFTSKEGLDVEIRVSIVPTTDGEKIVMRLLSESSRSFRLEELGMSKENYARFSEDIKKPWGMILVTGPTGSGKTTSLYSAIKVLNSREVNISTIEDPVEYDMDGVNQIQVNTKTELTFAKGLRSIVRQDPDIVMVGEIRDSETANIAVNAAMTGHLVLSTLHTNNAATAFPRLQDMGVENFLISSTVLSVIAQRLVRKICTKCIYSRELDEKDRSLIEHMPEIKAILDEVLAGQGIENASFFRGKGCDVCHNTGYVGRIGIFEILPISDTVREAIMSGANADQIQEIAQKEGMKTMLYDGIEKITRGVTTLEEVLRVTR